MCSPEDNLLDVLSDEDVDVEISEIDENILLGESTVTTTMKPISCPPSQPLTSSEPHRKIIKLNITTDKYSKIPPLLTSSNQTSFKRKKFNTFALEKKFKKTEPSLLLDTSTKSSSKTTSSIKNLSHDIQPLLSQSSQQQQSSLFYRSRGISFKKEHDVAIGFTLRHLHSDLHSDNSTFNLNHLKN